MDSQTLRTKVEEAIQAKLDTGECFTSACISHPIIKEDGSVRHREVNDVIKDMWASGGFVGDDCGVQTDYLRTLINVYPNGPGTSPVKAFCYHLDNGSDPYQFATVSRVLIRNDAPKVDPTARTFDMDCDDDEDDTKLLVNTADGGTVTKQCSVQTKDNRLNIPRFIIKAAGWKDGDDFDTEVVGDTVNLRLGADIHTLNYQCVDAEGRIRLGGSNIAAFDGATCTAALVDDGNGGKYIQVSK